MAWIFQALLGWGGRRPTPLMGSVRSRAIAWARHTDIRNAKRRGGCRTDSIKGSPALRIPQTSHSRNGLLPRSRVLAVVPSGIQRPAVLWAARSFGVGECFASLRAAIALAI